MAEYKVKKSREAKHGEDHSYSIDPKPGDDCVVAWTMNGRSIELGLEEGGLRVDGIGASGAQFTVEVIDSGSVTIRAIVDCPPLGKGLIQAQPYSHWFGDLPPIQNPEDASFLFETGRLVNPELNEIRVTLAEVQGRLAVLSRFGSGFFPQPTTVPETNTDIKDMVNKEFEDKSPSDIADASVFALQGVSERDAELLQEAFNVKTVRDFANLKFVNFARSIVALAAGDKS